MLHNYLKTALRSLLKKRIYSIINLLGLAVGISCSLLIFIYIHFELSFDDFHRKKDQIYRINTQFSFGDINAKTNLTPAPVLEALLREFPEVETGTRVNRSHKPMVVSSGTDKFQEAEFFYADSTFFDVFDFQLVSGNPSKSLSKPLSILLTETTAIKYFGTTDILNQELAVNDQTYLVTGVVKDPPNNTHLQFDFLASFVSQSWALNRKHWDAANYFTFVVINKSASVEEAGRKLQEKVVEALGPFDANNFVAMTLMPLGDIHLRSDISDELYKGDIVYIYIFIFIAVLITVIACVNYMNLSTARSVHRAKEVGMRKVLGAYKPQLFFQFIGESSILSGAAMTLAIIITASTLPQFAQLAGRPLDVSLFNHPAFYLAMFGLWILISFIAGTYPALVLSSYSPGIVLKSSFKDSGTGALLRKVLVIFQFAVSVFLFIGSLVIFRQLEFMQNKKLGYDKDNLIILPADRTVNQSFKSFQTEIKRIPEVQNAALANESLSQVSGGYGINIEGLTGDENVLTTAMIVSPDFVETTGLEIIVGSDFDDNDYKLSTLKEDPVKNVLINEELAKLLYQSPEEIVGKKSDLNGRVGVVKGVLKNFHFRSLKEKIQPIAFFIEPKSYNQMVVRVETNEPFKTVDALKSVWDKSFNHRPFEFKFLNQEYNALYESEEKLKGVYSLFTGLAIFIGCMGLFGLVSFSTVQRSKEIGIRKILGATVNNIVTLISLDFIKLVLIGFIVATPLAFWLMNQWLAGFEYRINFSWEVVAIALASQVILAMMVTSWQSVKAALANPVDAIRNE